LEELMNPFESSSSSIEKARVLPLALATRTKPHLVIAFGTAGSRPGVAANGSVVVGRRVFVHDPLASEHDRAGMWTPPRADTLVDSGFTISAFRQLSAEAKYRAEARFLAAPIGATAPVVLAGNGFISLGVVNILDYDQYLWADRSATAAFDRANVRDGQVGSIETTHGVIRASCDGAFLFVSGIVDMDGLFDYQVTPRIYAQNFVGAHNAAVATTFLLPELARLL
jgi:nucleoside phosphorylase